MAERLAIQIGRRWVLERKSVSSIDDLTGIVEEETRGVLRRLGLITLPFGIGLRHAPSVSVVSVAISGAAPASLRPSEPIARTIAAASRAAARFSAHPWTTADEAGSTPFGSYWTEPELSQRAAST